MCQAREAAGDNTLMRSNEALQQRVTDLMRVLREQTGQPAQGTDPDVYLELVTARARIIELEETVERQNAKIARRTA